QVSSTSMDFKENDDVQQTWCGCRGCASVRLGLDNPCCCEPQRQNRAPRVRLRDATRRSAELAPARFHGPGMWVRGHQGLRTKRLPALLIRDGPKRPDRPQGAPGA